jgi:hypothetical protein
LLLTLPVPAQAQFTYMTANGTITITGFTNMPFSVPASAVIPTTINGLPVTSIGAWAFEGCGGLNTITIPSSVTSIGIYAFTGCERMGVYFEGNAPYAEWIIPGQDTMFSGDNYVTVYYLPGTSGWSSTFGGVPTVAWFLPNPLVLNFDSFGVQDKQFGFIISWATNNPVVVEACTNLANQIWSAVSTNTLIGGWSYFTDPQWTNYPSRFYRLRSP